MFVCVPGIVFDSANVSLEVWRGPVCGGGALSLLAPTLPSPHRGGRPAEMGLEHQQGSHSRAIGTEETPGHGACRLIFSI